MSDTPRTDVVNNQCSDYTDDYATMRAHAEQLERELAGAIAVQQQTARILQETISSYVPPHLWDTPPKAA